ncbi:MAG TPA: C39 family peptidase, partial [Candidatus Ozemobacteraceae bacterium]|nr:C39 family peptidase [Candidatus Ozemobacteraceae bacterium]
MKKHLFVAVILLGIVSLLQPAAVSAQSPYNDDVVVTPNVAVSDTTQPVAPLTVASDTSRTEEEVASLSRSLWKELRRLYKDSYIGRRGRRDPGKEVCTPTMHHLPGYDNMNIDIDGDNYCGQFAMSTLLNGMGIQTDPQKVYKDTNPAGIFTAPPVIVEYLRSKGVDARMKNRASVSDITKRIDQGKPVMVLVDSGDGTPHWICIYGYDTDASGKVTSVRMRDSYWGTDGPHTMPIADFEKAWRKPFGKGILGDLMSYSNVLIDNNGTMNPSNPLFPGTFGTATEDNIAGAINDVVTGWQNHNVAQVVGGVTKAIVGLPGAITGVASNFL